jgi:hypothetical protein
MIKQSGTCPHCFSYSSLVGRIPHMATSTIYLTVTPYLCYSDRFNALEEKIASWQK